MTDRRFRLYDFMPYGAPELLENAPKRMVSAVSLGSGVYVALFLISMYVAARVPARLPVVIPEPTFTIVPPLRPDSPQQLRKPQIRAAAIGEGKVTPVAYDPPQKPEPVVWPADDPGIGFVSESSVTSSRDPAIVIQDDPDPPADVYVHADQLPEIVTPVKPHYPRIAWEAGVEGTVTVAALIGVDGRVRKVIVERSVPLLDEAAMEAARQWVFTPALSNNRPVKVWVRVPVRFTLR